MEQSPQQQLYAALAAAQADMTAAKKTAKNPFFKSKYAPLDEVVDIFQRFFAKRGICCTQSVERISDHAADIVTRIAHSSGAELATRYPIQWSAEQDRQVSQLVGSAVTYGRRYAMSAALSIVSDEDTDGELERVNDRLAQAAIEAEPARQQPEQTQVQKSACISDAQRKRLYAIAKGAGWSDEKMKEDLKAKFGYDSSKDILKEEYNEVVEFFSPVKAEV